jgi:hypothetical protein
MTKADDYRECAAECERKAVCASDPQVRKQMQDIAAQWRELAEAAEQMDRERR